jgi:hypothetical protein
VAIERCPTHDIPYNPDNPRGCPACAREREGDADQADLMRQLARSTRATTRPDLPPEEVPSPSAGRPTAGGWPITTPPRKPETEPTTIDRLLLLAQRRKLLTAGTAATVFLVVMLLVATGPEFLPQPTPPPLEDPSALRPLALGVNVPVTNAFSVLGAQPPRAVADQPGVQRHAYGARLTVDAINGVVYALRIHVASVQWRGLHVSMPEDNARGALSLLGGIEQLELPSGGPPNDIDGYAAYRSVDDVPRRVIGVAVRPPNGCFDVQVTIQPQLEGILADGPRRYAVIGRAGTEPVWVVTAIAVVSRAMRGPGTPAPSC